VNTSVGETRTSKGEKNMAILSRQAIQKQPGYLYYLGKDGYVWASPMKHNKEGKAHRVGNEHVQRPAHGTCWVNGAGHVESK